MRIEPPSLYPGLKAAWREVARARRTAGDAEGARRAQLASRNAGKLEGWETRRYRWWAPRAGADRIIHYEHQSAAGARWVACNGLMFRTPRNLTADRGRTTCGNCKRTKVYRAA